MERDQATRMMQTLLKKLVAKGGSDLFITAGFPPAIKIDGEVHRAAQQELGPDQAAVLVRSTAKRGISIRRKNVTLRLTHRESADFV